MENQNYRCFEEAIGKAERIKSAAEYLVLGNELEALLRLSTSDYISCLNEYSKILDELDGKISRNKLSKDDLKSNLIRLYAAVEMIMPLSNSLSEISVGDLSYEGDQETGLQFITYLTNECSKRTIGLAERIEHLVKREDIAVISKKERLHGKLEKFIVYCKDLRKNKKVISDDLYKEFTNWKIQLDKLATSKNGNGDLVTRGLSEISWIFNMYESQIKLNRQIFDPNKRGLKSKEIKEDSKKPKIDLKRIERWMEES